MIQVNDPILREVLKKEYKLMYLCDLKTKAEVYANRKNSRLDSLNKQILALENLLEGEYERLRT